MSGHRGRRRFLQAAGGVLGAGVLGAPNVAVAAAAPLDARRLRKFVMEVPRPARVSGAALDIPMVEFRQRLHPDLPPTLLWGYGGQYPGPTIEAVRGQPLQVTWRNELHAPALLDRLPVDQSIHWAAPLGGHHSRARYRGPVPTVVHLHGGETASDSDGHPEAWFTPGFARKGPAWSREAYAYPNAQPAATLWYHDHGLGITRLTVYAGLAGFYLIRDPAQERALNLPAGEYERELMIQDRSFDAAGQLRYPQRGSSPKDHPYWVPEFYGDTNVVNGAIWPRMSVEPRKYRFRLLNGSNARFYRLALSDRRPLVLIGTDGGYLPTPVSVTSLLLMPGARADVVVDFSGLQPGATVRLTNHAAAPYPDGEAPDPRTVGEVMAFRVVPLRAPDDSTIPTALGALPVLGAPSVTRTLTLDEHVMHGASSGMLLDGKHWSAPVSEVPALGATEVWAFANLTEDSHPMHLHLVQFQVLDRQALDVAGYAKAGANRTLAPFLRGAAMTPADEEGGWKDIVQVPPKLVTRIKVRFATAEGGAFPFDATAGPGYVWHCHILEHEDNEMMRPYRVVVG